MDRMRHWLNMLGDYARDYLLENTGLKVLALLITAVLWLSVAARPENRITIPNVPIEFRGLPDNLEMSKYETLTARVNLKGPSDVLDNIRPSDLSTYGDLSGVEPGVRVVPLRLDTSRLPTGVEGEVVDPRNVRVTVERHAKRFVPIRPRFEGQLPEGYELYHYTITPDAIRISGAESSVQAVTEVSTETVSLAGKTEAFSEPVAIDTGSANVTVEDNREVMLSVVIGEVRKERVIDKVPVTIVGGPPPARALPQFVSVTVYGARSAVDAMTAADLTVTVGYQEGESGRGPLAPQIVIASEYANRVSVSSVKPDTVRIR